MERKKKTRKKQSQDGALRMFSGVLAAALSDINRASRRKRVSMRHVTCMNPGELGCYMMPLEDDAKFPLPGLNQISKQELLEIHWQKDT